MNGMLVLTIEYIKNKVAHIVLEEKCWLDLMIYVPHTPN